MSRWRGRTAGLQRASTIEPGPALRALLAFAPKTALDAEALAGAELLESYGGRPAWDRWGRLLVFDRPWNAVAFALARREQAHEQGQEGPIFARLAVEVTLVRLRSCRPGDPGRGGLVIEGEDGAPLARSMVTLALPGQTLLSGNACQMALDIRSELYGPDHPKVAESLDSIGVFQLEQDPEGSERLFRRTPEIRQHHLPAFHTETLKNLDHLALALTFQGRFDEAEDEVRGVLEVRRRLLGPDHLEVGKTLQFLGLIRQFRGDFEQAEAVLLDSLEILEGTRILQGRLAPIAIGRLVELYEAWGKPAKAEEYRSMSSGEGPGAAPGAGVDGSG